MSLAKMPPESVQDSSDLPWEKEEIIRPKVFIFVMFEDDAADWLAEDSDIEFVRYITMHGLSRGNERVYINGAGSVCLVIVGTGLVNAALTTSALTTSPLFDLSKTYFLLASTAAINPRFGTVGSVAIARFAIQVDTQLEFDGRSIPSSWESGYVPLQLQPSRGVLPRIHGSDVFELNNNLRDAALVFARRAVLEDSRDADAMRAFFQNSEENMYHMATLRPAVIPGDTISSNTIYRGELLCEAMAHTVKSYTSGKGEYVMMGNEDTAVLAAFLRSAIELEIDFRRIVLMRSASDFDRSHDVKKETTLPKGFPELAARNLYLAGAKVVRGILIGWDDFFEHGIKATNYVGDYYASLGGTPDFLDSGSVAS